MTLRRFIRDTLLPNVTESRRVAVTPPGPNRKARRDHGYRAGHQTQVPAISSARRRRKQAARAHRDRDTGTGTSGGDIR